MKKTKIKKTSQATQARKEAARKLFEQGLSYKEIAKKIKVAYGTVRTWSSKENWGKENKKEVVESIVQLKEEKKDYIKLLLMKKLSLELRITNLLDKALKEIEFSNSIDMKKLLNIARINDNSSNIIKFINTVLEKQFKEELSPNVIRNFISEKIKETENL